MQLARVGTRVMQLRSKRAAASLASTPAASALAEAVAPLSPPTKKPRAPKPSATVPIQIDEGGIGAERLLYHYPALVPARILRRYKRFLADVVLVEAGDEDDGSVDETKAITIYCPNTGPMVGLLDEPNARVQLSKSDDPKRKYAYTLEMVRVHNGERHVWVGVHSTSANYMVEKAIQSGWFTPQLGSFDCLQREVKFSKNSRVDFVLSRHDEAGDVIHQKYVEVKSVTLACPLASSASCAGLCAVFPDTKSDRAQKHVAELTGLITHRKNETSKPGKKKVELSGAIIFLVQRDDCETFMPSLIHDVKFAQLCAEAETCGIQLLSYACRLEPDEPLERGHVRLLNALPLNENRAQSESDGVAAEGKKTQKKTFKK